MFGSKARRELREIEALLDDVVAREKFRLGGFRSTRDFAYGVIGTLLNKLDQRTQEIKDLKAKLNPAPTSGLPRRRSTDAPLPAPSASVAGLPPLWAPNQQPNGDEIVRDGDPGVTIVDARGGDPLLQGVEQLGLGVPGVAGEISPTPVDDKNEN